MASLKTNDFLVSGFLFQPDGITPVAGDVEVIITNNGAVSNSNVPFTVCTTVRNGQFSVSYIGLSPSPAFAAAEGDILTFEFHDLNTKSVLRINNNGSFVNNIQRKILAQDIIAQNGDASNPSGKVEIAVTLADTAKVHSNDILFRGDVFQPDGTTAIPLGAEILIENLTKNTSFRIPIVNNGDYFQNIAANPGFDSGDQLRYSLRNTVTQVILQVRVAGVPQNSITVVLADNNLVALGVDPNKGELIQTFILSQNFEGLLLPPTLVSTNGQDGKVSITWSNVFNPDLAGFDVLRSLTAIGPFFKINSSLVANTQFVDTNVFNGTPYFYQIVTVLGNGNKSDPSAAQQGTPQYADSNFSIRQTLNARFVAGRNLLLSFSPRRVSGATNGLSAIIKYLSVSGETQEFVVSNPTITSVNTFVNISVTAQIPDDAEELLDIRFRQVPGSSFIIDKISLSISGTTSDPDSRNLVAPSYNLDGTKIIVKNKLPGDLILVDVATGTPTRLTEAGNETVEDINATEDPVEWAGDRTIVYSFLTGRDIGNNLQSELRKFDFVPNTASSITVPATVPDSVQGFFPKFNAGNQSIVFLMKALDGSRSIKSIGIRDDFVADNLNIDARNAESIDLDADGNIVLGTNTAVVVNDTGGGQNRLILPEGSDFVQWGNKDFIPGKLIAYQKGDTDSINAEVYALTLLADIGSDLVNRSEFVFDTRAFPDGPLNIRIRAVDESVGKNSNIAEIHTLVNNTFAVNPMTATAITDPGIVTNTSTVTAPGAILGGITNKAIVMSAGNSSANRGKIEFFTRDDDQLLTTVEDTFTFNPRATVRRAGIPTALPIKLRLTWQTNFLTAEPGGRLNPTILTVDTGGVVRNIFLPEIFASSVNPLVLYIAEDGSTFYDPQLRLIAREATTESLIRIPPELDILPKYTRATSVLLQWCNQPGSPRDSILKYVLLRSTDPLRDYKPIFESIDNSLFEFRDPDLTNGAVYFYKIRAIDLLGNVAEGSQVAFTVIDQTGAIEKLGFLQVDLNLDDAVINESDILEPGSGKVFSEGTSFSLNPTRNSKSPTITPESEVFADFTYQKAGEILLALQPVMQVSSVVGEISGAFTQDVDFIFVEDNGVLSGSTQARDKIRFIKQEKTIVEEEVVRGPDDHGADGLSRLFAVEIESIALPIEIQEEPAVPVAGFTFQVTNMEPGKIIDGKRQRILQVDEVINITKGFSYQVDNIRVNYNASPALLELNVNSNMGIHPFPDPTDEISVSYFYLRVYPHTSYHLDKSQNAVRWLGTNPTQPRSGNRYLVTYRHLAPIPGERITVQYTTNRIIRVLQFGDINTGFRGLNLNRHICADVLARETTPVPIDVNINVRLFDTADEGFVNNQILDTVSSLFTEKRLGDGLKISDISSSVTALADVESIKLDPIGKVGRVDTPYFLNIDIQDTVVFSVPPGRVEGEVTFYTSSRPPGDIIIPSGTIVSTEFSPDNRSRLFETRRTLTAPHDVIDSFYNKEKDRYEFRTPVRALFEGAAIINRKQINTVGGVLKSMLSVENESLIEGAVVRQEEVTGDGTLTLTTRNGQLLEILSVKNFSAENSETTPVNASFIKLQKNFITNASGDALGQFGDSSLVLDDTVVFNTEVEANPARPGEYFVNYHEGFIQTFTKTAPVDTGRRIKYRYLEEYDLSFVRINAGQKTFTLHGASNAGRPVPQSGDTILLDYRWQGTGVPLQYRIEKFSEPDGVLDLSYIEADKFKGAIYLNNRQEKIDNVKDQPEPPFYAYDKTTRILTIVGRTLTPEDEVLFRFSTPFGDVDLFMKTFDLKIKNNLSQFTFNVDFRSFAINTINFLEMGGDSVQSSPGMIINAGLPKSSIRTVVVQFAAVGAKDMILSHDPLFRDKTELDFEPFSTAKVFLMSAGDGIKTIYAKLRFDNPAIKDAVLSSQIELDTTFNEGRFIPIENEEFAYSAAQGLLRIPKSFGQSDININDMESIRLNEIVIEFDRRRATRGF